MGVLLNETEQIQFKKFEKTNRALFRFSLIQVLLVVGIWIFLGINQLRVANFISDSGPEVKMAIERLDKIVPQSKQEAYLRDMARDLIPVPMIGIKIVLIGSTLTWLFLGGLCSIGFAHYQRKQMNFFEGIIRDK